ncbi:unnamed protein product, partial [Ectocarpus sp. 8 AP-2014]
SLFAGDPSQKIGRCLPIITASPLLLLCSVVIRTLSYFVVLMVSEGGRQKLWLLLKPFSYHTVLCPQEGHNDLSPRAIFTSTHRLIHTTRVKLPRTVLVELKPLLRKLFWH